MNVVGPLAAGRRTRDWSSGRTARSAADQNGNVKYGATADTDRRVVERAEEIAKRHGIVRLHVVLAQLLQKEPVTAPLVGATNVGHLEDAVKSLPLTLSTDDISYLEELYVTHAIVSFS